MKKEIVQILAFWCMLFVLLCCNAVVIQNKAASKAVSQILLEKDSNELKPKIAITFDDGPHPVYTPKVLDVLKEKDVKATFFLMGKLIPGNEELVRRISDEGHLLGNHTYDHVNLKTLSDEKACEQLTKTYNLIYEVTGKNTEYVRPPFGAWDKKLDCKIDMIPVMWNIDTMDWKSQDVGAIMDKVIGKVGENDIILMHDGYDTTVEALRQIIDYLQKEGYDIVTVEELILE